MVSDEIEAEIIKGRLESEGIPSRVAFRSRYGLPRGWSPTGLGYGSGSFEVRVASELAKDARQLIAPDASSRRPRTHPAVRIIATVLLLAFLLMNAIPLAQYLEEALGR